MISLPSSAGVLLAFLIAWLAFPRPSLAYLAYIDPGTGSYLLQLLFAAILGGLFALKLFWTRVKTTIAGMFGKGGANCETEIDSEAGDDSEAGSEPETDGDSEADGDAEP